jgi:ABC-type sugar transport system permease subunit
MRIQRNATGFRFLFLLPACALYGLFVVWPLAQAFVFSLFQWNGVSQDKIFIGLANFRTLFVDRVFWLSIEHNLALFVVSSIIILTLSLLLAHAVSGDGRGARLLRGLYLFSQIISMVAVAILWRFIYNPTFGIGHWIGDWLGSPTMALPAVGIVFIWQALGFYIMIFAAGLRTIPGEVFEAAELDGSTGWGRFRALTFPLLWSVLRIALVYLVINTLNVFALVFLMTSNGQTTGTPDRHTEMILPYLYERAFIYGQYGLGTALAVANFVLVMVMTGLVFTIFRKDPQEAAG